MTIKEVVAGFQREKQEGVASRFPCRAIMVKNIKQYCELLSELKKISCIRIIQVSELFSSSDVMPRFENLKATQYHNQWVILTGVSEYLRMFLKKEQIDRRFANIWSYQAPANSKGRIIIPLWGCESQWFDSALNLSGDLRQRDFYFDCSDKNEPEQTMMVTILSGSFEKYISKLENAVQGNLKIGLRDWFDYWTEPSVNEKNFVILTRRYNSVVTTNGDIAIHVVIDMLAFIKEHMPGAEILTPHNCTDDMQSILFDYSLQEVSLNVALLKILNVSIFSGVDIMGKWKNMSASHKQFIKLWLSIYPDGSYTDHCFRIAKNIYDVSNAILLEIFNVWQNKSEWIEEYHSLRDVMAIEPNDRFFEELDKISSFENRLDFITGNSREERIYLIRMVGKFMKSDYDQITSCEKLRRIYPELFFYLGGEVPQMDVYLKEYLARYKAHKLGNTLPEDEDVYFAGFQTDVYDKRYSVLVDNIDDDTFILWIDALGVEWLPLLYWTIKEHFNRAIVSSFVGQAILPTETYCNDLWNRMNTRSAKLDKLDKLAHKGVVDEPDYYTCIEEQLSFVTGIHKNISDLLKEHNRVIITGDHGTSRLAARFFHKREGFSAPKDAIVCSYGRYCKAVETTGYAMPNTRVAKVDGTQYVVFTNYDHYRQSGFATGTDDDNVLYGEVHGGATPEEMLVPIIVIDRNLKIPLSAVWENNCVKSMKGKAQLSLTFNKPVHKLQVNVPGVNVDVSPFDGGRRWNVVIPSIKKGIYTVHIFANNILIDMPDITIISAISGDGDLP